MTARPKRIQLSRKKGWRMPPNTVKVARPSMWGNPFRVFGRDEYLYSDASHRRTVLSPWIIFDQRQDIRRHPATATMAVAYYRRWALGEFRGDPNVLPCPFTLEDVRRELGGKDLACWCPLDQPCHADVLLELANR